MYQSLDVGLTDTSTRINPYQLQSVVNCKQMEERAGTDEKGGWTHGPWRIPYAYGTEYLC